MTEAFTGINPLYSLYYKSDEAVAFHVGLSTEYLNSNPLPAVNAWAVDGDDWSTWGEGPSNSQHVVILAKVGDDPDMAVDFAKVIRNYFGDNLLPMKQGDGEEHQIGVLVAVSDREDWSIQYEFAEIR